jgi:ubiquinone/menaquinone biosynthesis C-methylase UbiE
MTDALKGFDAKDVYSNAAATYEEASRRYWQFTSLRTVERLRLQSGDAVLDLACGTAPATLAAARAVGPSGRVVGIDYAPGMLEIARRNVAASGCRNITLEAGDMTRLPYGAEFDAVICVLGIFFVDDMAAAARSLWSHVRPGGQLAVTTLSNEVWTPMIGRFVETTQRLRPEIDVVLPWKRAEDAETLRRVLIDGGIEEPQVLTETETIPFSAADWWTIVMGSGLRNTAVALGADAEEVRADNERWARDSGLTSVRVGANYAIAQKPAR